MNSGAPIKAITAPTGNSIGTTAMPRDQIGRHQQRGASDRAHPGQLARALHASQPQQLRNDQADEADRARRRHRQPGRE